MSIEPISSPFGLVSLCNKVAPLAATVVFAAPIPTLRQIAKDASVGSFPLLPYTSMLANCYLWLIYGVLKSESKIWVTNGIGLIMAIYYFLEFTKYSPKQAVTLPGSIKSHKKVVAVVYAGVSIIAITMREAGANFIGNVAVFFCIVMFASPLSALKVVIETRSAKSIPLPFTIATIFNCFAWTIVGIYDMNDVNVYLPNALGLSCGVAQLLLKLIYGDGFASQKMLDV